MKWLFLVKRFNALFKIIKQQPEKQIEMYICGLCESIFLDKRSYILHFQLDSCVVIKDPTPPEPLELRLDI